MTGIEDILIMNADVYLEKNTLESIMKSKLERVVFADLIGPSTLTIS